MQKKICFILLGYMAILSVVGIWFYFHRQLQNLPLLEEAVLKEIISSGEDERTGDLGGTEKESSSGSRDLPKDDGSGNYWEGYHNSINQEKSNSADVMPRLEDIQISTSDQVKILYILKKNLTNEDISFIMSLAKNGLTSDEKNEIKALLQRKLAPEDKQELKTVVLKYLEGKI